ncbi:MAG: hypothetical protein WA869_15510 [Alloacidobacterium sp.]|jgi:hypothetical protein
MAEESVTISSRRPLKERAADEFKRFIFIFLYLWVVFALLSLHKSFVLSQHRLDYQEHTFAFINAFIFAKVLLVGEHFQFGTRFKDKPLIYPILHKSFIFTVVVIGFHIVEVTLVGLWHGSIKNNLAMAGLETVPGILSWGIMSFIVLLPFFRVQGDWPSDRPQGAVGSDFQV